MVIVMFGSLFTFVFFGFSGGGSSSGNSNYNGFQLIDRGSFWSIGVAVKSAVNQARNELLDEGQANYRREPGIRSKGDPLA